MRCVNSSDESCISAVDTKKQGNKNKAILITVLCASLVFGGIALTLFVQQQHSCRDRYLQALAARDEDNYFEAFELFSSLSKQNYEDSAQQAKQMERAIDVLSSPYFQVLSETCNQSLNSGISSSQPRYDWDSDAIELQCFCDESLFVQDPGSDEDFKSWKTVLDLVYYAKTKSTQMKDACAQENLDANCTVSIMDAFDTHFCSYQNGILVLGQESVEHLLETLYRHTETLIDRKDYANARAYCDSIIHISDYKDIRSLRVQTMSTNSSFEELSQEEKWATVNFDNLQGTWVSDELEGVSFTVEGETLVSYQDYSPDGKPMTITDASITWYSRAYKGWTPVISIDDADGMNLLTIYATGIDGDTIYSWNFGNFYRTSD